MRVISPDRFGESCGSKRIAKSFSARSNDHREPEARDQLLDFGFGIFVITRHQERAASFTALWSGFEIGHGDRIEGLHDMSAWSEVRNDFAGASITQVVQHRFGCPLYER